MCFVLILVQCGLMNNCECEDVFAFVLFFLHLVWCHKYVIFRLLHMQNMTFYFNVTALFLKVVDMFFPGISGYVAANMFKKMGGDGWVWNINLTSALFAGES